MNNTTKLTYTQSTQSTNQKKIVRMQVHYADAYAGAIHQLDLYLANAWNGELGEYYTNLLSSTTRQKATIINYSFCKCIVTLLEFSQIPESYATAFYLANMEEMKNLMLKEMNSKLLEDLEDQKALKVDDLEAINSLILEDLKGLMVDDLEEMKGLMLEELKQINSLLLKDLKGNILSK